MKRRRSWWLPVRILIMKVNLQTPERSRILWRIRSRCVPAVVQVLHSTLSWFLWSPVVLWFFCLSEELVPSKWGLVMDRLLVLSRRFSDILTKVQEFVWRLLELHIAKMVALFSVWVALQEVTRQRFQGWSLVLKRSFLVQST